MIVELTFPTGVSFINYGLCHMLSDENHKLQVPDSVAKTLLTLAGVTGPTLSATPAQLLAAAENDFEANYILMAYGRPLPDSADRLTAAGALLAANGVPAVSMS